MEVVLIFLSGLAVHNEWYGLATVFILWFFGLLKG